MFTHNGNSSRHSLLLLWLVCVDSMSSFITTDAELNGLRVHKRLLNYSEMLHETDTTLISISIKLLKHLYNVKFPCKLNTTR